MKIRKARLKDLESINELGKSSSELSVEEGFIDPRDLEFAIKNRNGIFLVAEDRGEIVGFSYAQKEMPTYGAMVYNFMKKGYRGRGVGKRMVEMREKVMKEMGVESVYLLGTNPKIVKYMEGLGYVKSKKLFWMYKKI